MLLQRERHSAKCGSISDGFVESAWHNLFCAITQCGNKADMFAQRMRSTSRRTCSRVQYIPWPMKCNHRADQAHKVIDPELGRGHLNACVATFSVFTKFRPKDIGLQRLHYQASTNLALMQASMTYLHQKRGP